MKEKNAINKNLTQIPEPVATERVFSISSPAEGEFNVLHRIGREIVSGNFQPDTRLPDEASMLKRYSVSRTALREAYSKLAAKGLIVARPKVGTSVRPHAFWNMLDAEVLGWHLQTKPAGEIARELYTLRRMVEPAAAALAAQMRTEDDLARIERAFQDMKATSMDESELIEADLRFHVEILMATGNHFIGAFSALIHAAMMTTFKLSWRGAAAVLIKEERLLQHGEVLEAIRQRKAERAKERMEFLLDASINDVNEAIDSGA
jgi:DNA-binding FadR family transcriptional regulator